MPSSTSSSNRWWQDLAHAGFGVFTFVALAAAAYLTASPAARQADIVAHRVPPDAASFYLAHDRGGHVDHHVLYHGIDRVALARLRNADLLFLGNSRLMFALHQPTLQRFFAAEGLSYYALGFGHEEQDQFPLEIIRENDLRPSIVVVNVDGFFAAARSAWAARVIGESEFDAWKMQFEAETAHRVRRAVHRVVPHYVDLQSDQREFVIYRSREDGTWFVATDFGDGSRFDWPPNDQHAPGAASMRAAEAFKRELEARGARVILTVIPAPDVSLHRARVLAERLGLPLLVPAVDPLRTIDASHLSEESSAQVAASLLEQLRPFLP